MLVGCGHNIIPHIIHHDKSTYCSTEELVGILADGHARQHSSLLFEGPSLLEGCPLAAEVVHEEGTSLGGVDQKVLVRDWKGCV